MGDGYDFPFLAGETAPNLTRIALDPACADRAAFDFSRAHPALSAAPGQALISARLRRAVAMLGLFGLIAPTVFLSLISFAAFVFFTAALIFRLAVMIAAPRRAPPIQTDAAPLLPVYTLLIALNDEAACMAQLSAALRALDYPADRLDVKLLIETGDTLTADAIEHQLWPPGTELHVVPPGLPRTKPRALNYGLSFARGAYVVVYDAEDRPDPQQLKAVVAAFAKGPAHLACVQAPLVGVPRHGLWLEQAWSLEYASQFGQVLPGLARFGLPMALGGTSNHFRRRALIDAGGWDAWNVTEDADLGLRLARLGKSVGMVAPPTLEAPPEALGVWLAQRSRWLKGFLVTWLVLMRNPARLWRELGSRRFLALQLTLGGAILAALLHGPWAVFVVMGLVMGELDWTTPMFIAALISGALSLGAAFCAPGRKGFARLGLVLTLPLYWPLQSIAMARAVYGLFSAPQYWAKTPHGADGAPRRI